MTEQELKTAREAYYNSRMADYTLRIANATSLTQKMRLQIEMEKFKSHFYLTHNAKHAKQTV